MINVVMPMAGDGARFQQAGFKIIKPAIIIKGKRMFEWPLYSLKDLQKKLVCVVKDQELMSIIQATLPSATLIKLEKKTDGPVETVMQAKGRLDLDKPLLILDSDLYFEAPQFISYIANFNPQDGGALLTFKSDKDKYSYARIKDQLVEETAEKRVISNNALVGAYFFVKGHYFFDAAQEMRENREMVKNEYYVSQTFNKLIKLRLKIHAFEVSKYLSFGTPEELKDAESNIF